MANVVLRRSKLQAIGLLLVLVLGATYGLVTVLAFERWRWRGVVAVLSLPIVANLVVGTRDWARPHPEVAAITSVGQDWFCHATNLTPFALVVGLSALGAFTLTAHPGRWQRRAWASGAGGVAGALGAWLVIEWVIGILRCDAL